MSWVRRGLVHFLSVVLFASLVGGVAAINFNQYLAGPHTLERWLADSKIYDRLVPAALDQAQKSSQSGSGDSSVTFSSTAVQQAAGQAFSPDLLQKSVNSFLDSNYAWLNGKTARPEFAIDLSPAKQKFAELVGESAEAHLKSLPLCTPTQFAQLPVPADPLSISCRPGTLDPTAEHIRVTQEISSGNDFLSNPVITPGSLGQNQNSNQGQPYYQKLSQAPRIYRLALKLPWILGGLALLSALGIIFIAPLRRRGWRRIGVVFLEAGIVLIALKFVADALVNKLEGKLAHGNSLVLSDQLKQPVSSLLHRIETQLVRNDLWFGIAFVLIALAAFFVLFKTRGSKNGKPKTPGTLSGPDSAPSPQSSRINADGIQLAPRRQRHSGAVNRPEPVPEKPPAEGPLKPLGKNPPRPKRPRLIQ